MPVKVLPPSEPKSPNFIFPKIIRNFFKSSDVHRRRSVDKNASASKTSSSTEKPRRDSNSDTAPPSMLPLFSYHGKRRRSSATEMTKKSSTMAHLLPDSDACDGGYYSYSDLMHHHICDRSIASTISTTSSGLSSIDDDDKFSRTAPNLSCLFRRESFKRSSPRRVASLRVDPQRSDCWNLHQHHMHIDHQGHRRVMVAIDNSQNSERAFRWFLEYMMEPCDRVILVTIVDPKLMISSGMTPINPRDTESDTHNMMRSSQILIQRFLNRAGAARSICEAHAYMSCKQADSLVSAARFHKADVIVMGSRGCASPIKGFLLGSVSKAVLRSSPVPVTIVPPYDMTPSQDDAQIKIRPKRHSKKKPRKHSL